MGIVGVGTSSALNAFNIGREATGKTAIGQAIESIVAQADKLQVAQSSQQSGLATGIGVAQFKDQLESGKVSDRFGFDPSGNVTTLGLDIPIADKFQQLRPDAFDIPEVDPSRLPILPTDAAKERFFQQNPQHPLNPNKNLTPGANFDFSDPNRQLTPEEEAEFRRQNGLPPR